MKYLIMVTLLVLATSSLFAGEGERCHAKLCRGGDLYYGYKIPNGNLEIGFCDYSLIEKNSPSCPEPEEPVSQPGHKDPDVGG